MGAAVNEVTDPNLLAQLNGSQEVTDPNLLAQLNAQHQMMDNVGGQIVPSNSPTAMAGRSPAVSGYSADSPNPVTGEVGAMLQNIPAGAGQFLSDKWLGLQQMLNPSPQLTQQAADKRTIDAPLLSTLGGRAGQVGMGIATGVPLSAIPGGQTLLGGMAMGGLYGATEPTSGNESRLENTGIGSMFGGIGSKLASTLGGWISSRSSEPFMGWSPTTANRVAAESVGSDAANLNQQALGDAYSRLGGIFDQARNPAATVAFPALNNPTTSAINAASSGLNRSSAAAFNGNSDVSDLIAHINAGGANAQQLGSISSNLGREASAQMNTKDGDRALGSALFGLKEHVDDLIGGTITDPNLKAAYVAARTQYRNLSNISATPTILNSATGDVNMTALAKRLQRVDKPGYLRGGNDSDLYNAARWGQSTGEGKGAPPLNLSGDLGLNWLAYRAMNNPVSNAIGGTVSRAAAPVAPYVLPGLPGAAGPLTSALVPYLTQ